MKMRKRMLDGLDSDIREHIARETEDNIARGMNAADAREAALRKFGNATRVAEDTREVWTWAWLEQLAQDARFGLRMLRKSPGFTIVAVLTLALGIGASTAVFSLVDAVMLKPLPYGDAQRIVFPWRLTPLGLNIGFDKNPWGRVDFQYFAEQSKTLEHWGAFESDRFNLTGAGEPVRLDGLRASAGFFPSLGVQPALGRTFTEDEDQPGREHVVILSDALWRERFGADAGILGRTVEMNDAAYTVIGVMPRGFAFPRANEMPANFNFAPQVELWVPLALDHGPLRGNDPDELAVVGRLRDGVTVRQAQAEMPLLSKGLEALYPRAVGGFRTVIEPIANQITGETRRPLLLILGAVGVVMLIACSSVASMMLTRSLGRKRELTLRAALGAAGSRLVRQLLTESLLLAAMGGIVGMALARGILYGVKVFGPASIPRLGEVTLDARVFLFALGVTLLTGILFGLAPAMDVAIGSAPRNLVTALKEGGQRAGSSVGGQRARNVLLVGQIALALVLVIAAGLLTRTFYRLMAVDAGFHPARVLTFELSLPAAKYPDQAHIAALYTEVLRRLGEVPGVQAAGLATVIPMGGATDSTVLRIPGLDEANSKNIPGANYTIVSAGYFSAVATPILRGREFSLADTATSEPVAIVSEAMAKKYWPGQDVIGKQLGPRSPVYPLATIVGVAADVKRLSLREAATPEVYMPYTQKVWPSLLNMDILVRTAQEPSSVSAAATGAIHAVDPELPLANVKPLDAIVAEAMTEARFAMLLLAAFGALALAIATIGMYGVISYSVAQRTQEIGVRMALGAGRRSVLKMVLGQGARIAFAGIAMGLVAALAVTRLMRSFLYGVGATDPATFACVTVVIFVVAVGACYVPARRAMRVDPMVALRYE
jgi:predicted permease